jgi:hypothetical protein
VEHHRPTESPPAKAGSRFLTLGASPLRPPLMLRAKRLLTLRESHGTADFRGSPHRQLCMRASSDMMGGAMPGPSSGTDRAWEASSACPLVATAAPRGRHDPDRTAGRPAPLLPTPPARRSVRRGRPPLGRMDLACGSSPPHTYFHNCAPSLDGPSLLASLQDTTALPLPAWCPKLTKTPRLPPSRSSTLATARREQPRDPRASLQVTSLERAMTTSPHPCPPYEEGPSTFLPRSTGTPGSPGRILRPVPPPIAPHGPARHRRISAPEAPSTPLMA